jgi:hypothetical protein
MGRQICSVGLHGKSVVFGIATSEDGARRLDRTMPMNNLDGEPIRGGWHAMSDSWAALKASTPEMPQHMRAMADELERINNGVQP